MPIPSKETIIKGLTENTLIRNCNYLPCHAELETCSLCYCIFYPCEDPVLGEYKISRKGIRVWSCMKCSWVHRKETVEKLRIFLMNEENCELAPGEMYRSFVESIKSNDASGEKG